MGARPPELNDRFDPRIAVRIRVRAREMARAKHVRKGEQPDLRQELWAHFLKQLANYDPSRGAQYTFAECVTGRKCTDVVRHNRTQRRDRRREEPLDGVPDRKLAGPRERGWRVEQVDLRLDVRDALADLPDDVRLVAALLMVFGESEVVRRTGFSRQRVRTLRKVIERRLKERGLQ